MIGLLGATSLNIAGMVGAGILILPSYMSLYGTWSFLGWCCSGLMMFSMAIVFNRLSRKYKNKSPSECIAKSFNDKVGFMILFGYFIAMCASGSCIANALGNYLLPILNLNINPNFIGLFFITTLFLLNLYTYRSSTFFLILLILLKILFFGVVIFFGMFNIENYHPSFEGSYLNVLKAASISIFAFLGLEFCFVSTSNIKNPEKNVPLSTYIALAISALIFIGVHAAVLFNLENPYLSSRPVYDAVLNIFGPKSGFIFAIVGVVSCATTLNGIIMVQANGLKTASDNKWMFSSFSKLTKQGFAWQGGLSFVILATIILNSKILTEYSLYLANIFAGIMYLFCVLSDMKNKIDVVNVFALISSFLIIYNVNLTILLIAFTIYLIAYIIYSIYQNIARGKI